MCRIVLQRLGVVACLLAALTSSKQIQAAELSAKVVTKSIERARKFLISQQQPDGSWLAETTPYQVGVSSLVLLALLNSGMTVEDRAIAKALKHLRSIEHPTATYEVSLMIMALTAAKDGGRDKFRINTLAQKLEDSQIKSGENSGSWGYGVPLLLNSRGDRSNAQFAVLGLRDAAHAGISVSRIPWERARRHWISHQNPDGGWGYDRSRWQASSGSMTVAGIATLVITESMLQEEKDQKPDGLPICCPDREPNKPMQRALKWMERNFAVKHNPRSKGWLLYYLYGLERAGRLSGTRFFGKHDWYREGARVLVNQQDQRRGGWPGVNPGEKDPIIGTSFALLFLSKGLAPVLINKLKFGPPNPANKNEILSDNWNKHRNDVRNLTEHVSGLKKWPKLLTWQVVDLPKAAANGDVRDLLQAPILFMSGVDAPKFSSPKQIELLREYINQGGFIFAVANCSGAGFEDGFRELIHKKLFPGGEAELKRLGADHAVYQSEYQLDHESVELYGVDFGCRTVIIYSPEDLSCLWDKWAVQDFPGRSPQFKGLILRATKIGVNVVAYATGRELLGKLKRQEAIVQSGENDEIQRGLLEIAQIRHNGKWDAAPQALRNLLLALNRTVGLAASTKPVSLPATDPNIFKYPVVYMHGRNRFQLSRPEREQLKVYLSRGGVLFADSCCGSRKFDRSFRDLIAQMYPDRKFQRIPASHEIFSSQIGHNISEVKRRTRRVNSPNATLETSIVTGEPFLEGIEIEGRYAVIYSKYDISCALQRQSSIACTGYLPDDAVKIAVNVILYAMLQDVRFVDAVK